MTISAESPPRTQRCLVVIVIVPPMMLYVFMPPIVSAGALLASPIFLSSSFLLPPFVLFITLPPDPCAVTIVVILTISRPIIGAIRRISVPVALTISPGPEAQRYPAVCLRRSSRGKTHKRSGRHSRSNQKSTKHAKSPPANCYRQLPLRSIARPASAPPPAPMMRPVVLGWL